MVMLHYAQRGNDASSFHLIFILLHYWPVLIGSLASCLFPLFIIYIFQNTREK